MIEGVQHRLGLLGGAVARTSASPVSFSDSNTRVPAQGPSKATGGVAAHEGGGHHQLIAHDHTVQVQVVAVERPGRAGT